MRWYIDPINDRQTRYNTYNVSVLNQVSAYIDHLLSRIVQMEVDNAALKQKIDCLQEEINEQNHRVNTMNEDINYLSTSMKALQINEIQSFGSDSVKLCK